MDAPFALAFAAGLVASVNPCGFAMLPAYLSFLLGTGDTAESRPAAVARALRVGLTVSVGFLTVFGLAGIGLTAGARWLTTAIPFAALAVGVGLAAVGTLMLTGRSIPVRLPTITRAGASAGSGTGTGPTALFGVSYAIASLSCTLPVFLVVVGGAGTQDSLAAGVATFATYALGMALPLLGVAVALALGKDAFVKRVRAMARYTTRVAGGLLVLAGGYIVFYWATVLGPGQGTPSSGRIVTGVETLSSQLTTAIGTRPVLSGLVLTGAIATAIGYVWRSRQQRDTAQPPPVSQTRPPGK
ncbi:MAG: cytochrome c biogenesis CcdA family protein [Egibacteraceae bacterium]